MGLWVLVPFQEVLFLGQQVSVPFQERDGDQDVHRNEGGVAPGEHGKEDMPHPLDLPDEVEWVWQWVRHTEVLILYKLLQVPMVVGVAATEAPPLWVGEGV